MTTNNNDYQIQQSLAIGQHMILMLIDNDEMWFFELLQQQINIENNHNQLGKSAIFGNEWTMKRLRVSQIRISPARSN